MALLSTYNLPHKRDFSSLPREMLSLQGGENKTSPFEEKFTVLTDSQTEGLMKEESSSDLNCFPASTLAMARNGEVVSIAQTSAVDDVLVQSGEGLSYEPVIGSLHTSRSSHSAAFGSLSPTKVS